MVWNPLPPQINNIAKINCLPEITSSPQTNYLRNVETEGGTKQIVSMSCPERKEGAYLWYRFTQCLHRGLGRLTHQAWNIHISPPLRHANIEIQMVCVKIPANWGRAAKLLMGCTGGKNEFRRICHLLYPLPPRAEEDLILCMFVKSKVCHLCGSFPTDYCFVPIMCSDSSRKEKLFFIIHSLCSLFVGWATSAELQVQGDNIVTHLFLSGCPQSLHSTTWSMKTTLLSLWPSGKQPYWLSACSRCLNLGCAPSILAEAVMIYRNSFLSLIVWISGAFCPSPFNLMCPWTAIEHHRTALPSLRKGELCKTEEPF